MRVSQTDQIKEKEKKSQKEKEKKKANSGLTKNQLGPKCCLFECILWLGVNVQALLSPLGPQSAKLCENIQDDVALETESNSSVEPVPAEN